ncbi:MAG: hemolysin family protein [Clostridiales bacterium]|jgi:CBS domain containing-hemolysin-like protein|nr:hemolysin family protein [Clostridiales bacterium]
MDGTSIGLLVAIIVLVMLSAIFSTSETALTTASKIKLTNLSQNGNKRAGKVVKFIDNYDKMLSTILVGNNIVNITMASLGTLFFTGLMRAENAGLAATISTLAITAVVLIFGEITPKNLAKFNPEKVAMRVYPFIRGVSVVLTPVNLLFRGWQRLLQKIFKFEKSATFNESELLTIVETAESEGELNSHESRLIRSAIEFEDMDVKDIMIPRVNVISVAEDESVELIYEKFREHGFSRLPVYAGTIDSVVGIIHEKDFFVLMHEGGTSIKGIVQSSVCVSSTMKISTVLRMLQKAKIHMAIVIDEFGGTEGIVTLEDILEELVGEIYDEHDEIEELFYREDDTTYIVSGDENVDDMFENLGIEPKEEIASTTVSGFVTEIMDKIPAAGEKFVFENLDIEVTKATARHVVEVRVVVLPQEAAAGADK